MKSLYRVLFLFVILTSLQACSDLGLFVVNNLAKLEAYQVSEPIQFTSRIENQLTVYSPEGEQPARATIVFFYGGCWGGCETLTREYYVFVAEALTSQGFNVVISDYRRYPEVHLASIMEDAKATVEWVNTHIYDVQGKPSQIILMGHSAGAHIAALLNYDERYLSPASYHNIRGFIGLAGPYDFLPLTEDYQREVFAPVSNYQNTQPVNFVDGREPPALLLYGDKDTKVKVRNINSLARTIKSAGGQVKTHFYEGVDHTDIISALSIPLRNEQPIFADIIEFADSVSQN